MNHRKINVREHNISHCSDGKDLIVTIELPERNEVIRHVVMAMCLSRKEKDFGTNIDVLQNAIGNAVRSYKEQYPEEWKGFDTQFIIRYICMSAGMIRFDVVRVINHDDHTKRIIEAIKNIEV